MYHSYGWSRSAGLEIGFNMAETKDAVAGILECKICLGRLNDPKMLACRHLFCKNCLEDVIKFNNDGSAVICCPLRCGDETYLGEKQTINDMGTSYEIRAIIEHLNTTEKSLEPVGPPCTYTKDCNKDISVICCGHKMCRYCLKKHNLDQTLYHGKTDVMIDTEQGNLVVKCDEHFSRCTHLCTDGIHSNVNNNFICIYCLNRDHKEHTKDSIEDQVVKIKQALTNSSINMENLCKLRKVTEDNIALCIEKLDMLLRERTEHCLSKYIDSLMKEEEMIRNVLMNLSHEHIQQYPPVLARDYYEERIQKQGIDLLIAKTEILDTICKHNYLQMKLKCVDISLSEGIGIKSERPLGDLKISGASIPFPDLDPSVPTFKDTIKRTSNHQEISQKLLRQLKELTQEYNCDDKQIQLKQEIVKLEEGLSDKDRKLLELQKEVAASTKQFAESKESKIKELECMLSDANKKISHLEGLLKSHGVTELQVKNLNRRSMTSTSPSPRPGARPRSSEINACHVSDNSTLADDLKRLDEEGFKYIEGLVKGSEVTKLKSLLEAKPEITKMRNVSEWTPFMYAAAYGTVDTTKMFEEYGANTSDVTRGNCTALHLAVRHDKHENVQWLCESHVELSCVKEKFGVTPLHIAASKGHLNTLKVLLRHHVDVTVKDKYGRTPLDCAKEWNKTSCIKELEKWEKERKGSRKRSENEAKEVKKK